MEGTVLTVADGCTLDLHSSRLTVDAHLRHLHHHRGHVRVVVKSVDGDEQLQRAFDLPGRGKACLPVSLH